MWWLDPGKEVLNVVFNRVLAPYIENLDLNQVNYGIGQGMCAGTNVGPGQLTLRNLRLKKGALDKFRLPVDVSEGSDPFRHLGTFTLSLHWMNLGNQPVEVLIEDVYLLVVPSPQTNVDPKEEEDRAQAAKMERLENAELLHVRGQTDVSQRDGQQSQGLIASLIAKVVNNLQVTVKNIHVRYEDKMSVEGHPFAAGLTLAGFSAVSTNENWEAAFIESAVGAIHKLAKLRSLAVYFDTDSESMAGLPPTQAIKRFTDLIATEKNVSSHQFILKPVTGEGRIVMNNKIDKDIPRFDVQLLFDEIGVIVDDNQYRDAISLVDMFHFYSRQRQYRKVRPSEEDLRQNRARALFRFAGNAILSGIQERNRKWTWSYFAERRDDRKRYVELFKQKSIGPLVGNDLELFESLERKLSYEDIRFYRSIARSQLKKDYAARRKIEEERKKQQASQSRSGWGSWLWGSSSGSAGSSTQEPSFSGEMTDEQRKELYEVLDYDEKAALVESFEAPRDALKAHINARLQRGSFALKADPHGSAADIISLVYDNFRADVIQRPDNFETSISLGDFRVFDGTTPNTLYHQIVHVKDSVVDEPEVTIQSSSEPFFFLKFENNPLDERADTALTMRMRHMEIIYHKGYIEAIYRFFKPPKSQLESVEALLDAASQTLEGLRKETRAGLEYALQAHKTIDVHMDLNAPIIIIPEDITTNDCRHLIVDAGHIAIESDLADKNSIREVQLKRNQQYTEEDYKRLESLMYDKLSLRLEAAQFVLGNNLQSCRAALAADTHDNLHLLERINLDFQVQNSIVPSVYNLARFKLSGSLPTLQINLSDVKYKSLMRLIDVAIPHFDDGETQTVTTSDSTKTTTSNAFALSSGLFGPSETEYSVDTDEEDEDETPAEGKEQFFDVEENTTTRPELHQHTFEFNFSVDEFRVSLFKSNSEGERAMGDLNLEGFALAFAMAKYNMQVDVNLRALSMNVSQHDKEPIKLVSSATGDSPDNKHLMTIKYTRADKTGPEFDTTFQSIDQNVDITLSTFIFRAAPEPVVLMYDFIMSTFMPKPDSGGIASPPQEEQDASQNIDADVSTVQADSASSEKMRVVVKLASVQVILINDDIQLATLSLSTADVAILLRDGTMRVSGRVGTLSLSDDSSLVTAVPEFKHIMSIEGDNFAVFSYQTYDSRDTEVYTGVKASVSVEAASIHLHFLEQPLHDIYLFLVKLAKLKGLYDAATQAAIQSASEMERVQYQISIKSPVLVFPCSATESKDILTMRLGEAKASNAYDGDAIQTKASLHGVQLTSTYHYDENTSMLKIIDDIDINAIINQTTNIDHTEQSDRPDTQITVTTSDIKLHLTQMQYRSLIALSNSIPRVLAGAPEGSAQAAQSGMYSSSREQGSSDTSTLAGEDLRPELLPITSANGTHPYVTLDFALDVNSIKLHLYDENATTSSSLKEHGIARFALNHNSVRFKLLSDGAGEAQVVLQSFIMSNTRPGNSRFREIIPAAQHDRNQVMVLYTMTAGTRRSAMAVATIDSPETLLAIDLVFALLNFFTHGIHLDDSVESYDQAQETTESHSTESSLDFRVDLHDLSVIVLENDALPNTQAIQLSVKQILVSQQGILAVTVERLGMSLIQMGKESERVSFLDEMDFTLSLDSRSSSSAQQMTSIEVSSKPVIFRASYRDINLITKIVNKALLLYGESEGKAISEEEVSVSKKSQRARSFAASKSKSSRGGSRTIGKAEALLTKEQFTGSFDGFRLVLIGDIHEQPMLHLKVKRFIVGAKDWSRELQATTTMSTQVSYWNLTNSHWEPLIDPWTFTASISRDEISQGLAAKFASLDRLDLNVSTTFVELLVTTAKLWGKEGEQVLQKARGSYAPYRIRNRTGSPLYIWSDVDDSSGDKSGSTSTLADGQVIDWRFDDWRTIREHSSIGQHNIGVQFIGKPWEKLRSIPVDREGEYAFSLRPQTDKYFNRLLCEVQVQEDNVKVVTLRSTYKVENQTLYPVELTMVDESGRPVYSLEKIAPGQDFSLPIEAVGHTRIRIQPDQGFGYKWSSAIRWEDLISKKNFAVRCPHTDEAEAAFRFQACVQTDLTDPATRRYPKIHLRLRAPIELENLLPYNVQYRIYDKDSDQNWRSYLRKGGIMPVHSVELGHLVLLNVQVEDTVFQPSDFAIINTDGNSDLDIDSKLTMRDAKGRKLDLRLNYVRYPNSGGAFKVQIYSPYLVINKTGLPFSVRCIRSARPSSPQDAAGDARIETLSKPVPFMLSHPQDKRPEFTFQLSNSVWSRAVSLEAPAADTRLVLSSQSRKGKELHVGLSWTEASGKYKLTKVITLAPRFLVKNCLPTPLVFREHGVPPHDRSTLQPDERASLDWTKADQDKLLTVALPGLDAVWSAPINIEDIGSVHFRLREPGKGGVVRLVKADVKIDGATIFVIYSLAQNGWPFVVENDSDFDFTVVQTDDASIGVSPQSRSRPSYTTPRHSSMEYAWDYPAARDKKLLLRIGDASRVVDIMEIGDLMPFRFPVSQGTRTVSLDVRADGPRQVLRITNYNPVFSLYKPKHRQSTTPSRSDTISSQDAFEAVTEQVTPSFSVNVNFAGIGLSLINRKLVEVVYLSVNGLKFEYSASDVAQALNLTCDTLQIDNQLHDGIFPVVLQPTPVGKEANGGAALPTIQASVIWLNDNEHGVMFIKYCSILLQALTIEADEDFVFELYELSQFRGASWEEAQDDVLIQNPDSIPEPQDNTAGQDLYFEVLELQPIKLAISFMRTERVSSDERLSTRNPLAVLVNALTMTLGNINDAPLELNALAIKDMRLTPVELQNRVIYHYRQDTLRQLYRIIGSADFIGNPVGLFTNVSSGVADIFYEPWNGVVMHGNRELGIGIAKGAASFVKKTVFGLSDSMTKFTSSVGKGLSAATFDSEYQNRRRMTQRRNKPRHAIYGVTAGAEALANSVASGVEGVVMKPIEGAESGGAVGFFKGVGKGLVGAVTKPVIGVFDLASNVSEGIRNTTTVFDNPERDRVRLPRHIPADGVLVPYSSQASLGQYWMKDLEEGRYRRECYVAHINLPGGDNVVLLTAERILSFWSRRLRLEWELPFTHVRGVTIEDTGIRFAHKSGKEHDRFVFVPDKTSQTWFFGQVAAVVKSFNVRRRMDA
ncbi:vacuolar protein sorting-associated protein 13 [Neolentinus lepideus HHB14362 ss-1]|uniref:Vacuolar protein sorting-associated protein 13 n=1 Tax=Neolentinus lepideus HHB14362 ss-1 TaxID=1314782 RepID=A0A165W2P0_9AGAM|nr:vacuolar protein sorting-associated protein 13 [Neolentinus lepideus HHB14362 ss-1]